MSDIKRNWPVTVGVGVAIGLALMVILKNSQRPENEREHYRIFTDLKAIKSCMEQYNMHYGHFPTHQKDFELNFAEQFSNTPPSKDVTEARRMYVDFARFNVPVDNDNYAAPNADSTKLLDPWGQVYRYQNNGKSYLIWSIGVDKIDGGFSGDDIGLESLEKPQIPKEIVPK
jgi:hypothetical protein